jgi:hypothetical protein
MLGRTVPEPQAVSDTKVPQLRRFPSDPLIANDAGTVRQLGRQKSDLMPVPIDEIIKWRNRLFADSLSLSDSVSFRIGGNGNTTKSGVQTIGPEAVKAGGRA